ncbi:LacI family DNA-binding transcriptional regulator [Gordonia sp. Z-3]|uniref:LacI family DNA-binding transcriptional regulator n=1 Tax=Gordonia sp. Z-3 TaxID=3115408 RepID=UPI002E2DB3F8|nr:LacI family DNA-binding transcriptional regulator [Gordonia sp. Z-3]MED5802757.1 LacI family DNA-binding transcriptional regulator [Gordonia sp. Z-3]
MTGSEAHDHTNPQARPRPTMADIAAHVGVSRQLVSLVMRGQPGASPSTRQKIVAAAKELEYHPDGAARLLRRTRSGLLGVLFTGQHPFELALVENMYPAVAESGYAITLGTIAPTHEVAEALDEMLSSRIEALILVGPQLPPQRLTSLAAQMPIVEVGRHRGTTGIDAVYSDGEAGMRLAVDHLVGLGHRRIAHVDGGTMPGAADRRRGYIDAMTAQGRAAEIQIIDGDYSEMSGYSAAQQILEWSRRPTAVIAANDRCALGVLGTLVRAGISVPGEISVIGYDDDRTSRLPFVDLTTVRQDAAEIAQRAVGAVVERLAGQRTDTVEIVVSPALCVRGSTGPVPGVGPES